MSKKEEALEKAFPDGFSLQKDTHCHDLGLQGTSLHVLPLRYVHG